MVVRGGGGGCVELCVSVEFTSVMACPLCGPGVERTVAQGLLNRLEREGFVSSARGRRVTRKVLKEELARGMGRFMLKRAQEAGQEAPRRGTKEEAEKASVPTSLCPLAVVEGSCVALMWCATTGTLCGTDNTGCLVTQPGGAGPAPGKGGWGWTGRCEGLSNAELLSHPSSLKELVMEDHGVRRSPRLAKRARAVDQVGHQ